MYYCMRTLGQVILEKTEWSFTIYIYIYIYIYRQNLYNYLNEINLCLCYLLYFEIKIAMKTNQRPFAYCQIMLALISADSP